jgi:hypothetical protein
MMKGQSAIGIRSVAGCAALAILFQRRHPRARALKAHEKYGGDPAKLPHGTSDRGPRTALHLMREEQ